MISLIMGLLFVTMFPLIQ